MVPTPAFTRLARVHALSAAADALFATALAGSLFFSIPVGEARTKVFAYLAGAMAPFTVLSPLIGPAIDRVIGGRRLMVIISLGLRAAFALLLITTFDDLAVFLPLAFGILVLQKGYSVARSALVPTTVDSDDELVRANSKLSVLSGVMGFVAAGPGALALWLIGPEGSLTLACIVYGVGLVFSFRLPPALVARSAPTSGERSELHSASILLAAGGMGLLRGIVGFLSILVAFSLRSSGEPLWHYGVVGAGAVGGSLVGSLIAPRLREVMREEMILITVLLATVVAAVLSAFVLEGVAAPMVIAMAVGIAAAAGKQSFDSILQRDAPEANRGRAFARFETRFQIFWVIGASIAVIPMALELGFLVVLGVSVFAAFTYGVGLLAARQRAGAPPTVATAAATEVEARMAAVSGAARRQAGRTAHTMWDRVRPGRHGDGDEAQTGDDGIDGLTPPESAPVGNNRDGPPDGSAF
ncbi:MAG TPA: MFS transporter [Acidimicrobiales bacterium]|nr:MFS transporter [Acidimicrobiales bacterium]